MPAFSIYSCVSRWAPALTGAALAVLAGMDHASAQCPETAPPAVRLESDQPEPSVSRKRSIADLRKLAHSDPHEVALGLYTGELRTTLKIDYQILERGDRACLRVSEAVINVAYTTRMIYLARELERGSCQYDVALDHERHHARIDDAVLARELPRLRLAVADAVTRLGAIGPIHPSELDDEREKLAAALQQVVRGEVARIDRARRTEQGALDTPESYRREAARCPGGLGVR